MKPREQRRTALLVGEGLAEQVFLGHLKQLYVPRGSRTVTIKNAKGKGGSHVLDVTLRQAQLADYDEVGVLLDTDAQWGEPQRAKARNRGARVFESDPCLEVLLLRVAGEPVPQGGSRVAKRAFLERFGDDAHVVRVYERYFGKQVLDEALERMAELRALVDFLRG